MFLQPRALKIISYRLKIPISGVPTPTLYILRSHYYHKWTDLPRSFAKRDLVTLSPFHKNLHQHHRQQVLNSHTEVLHLKHSVSHGPSFCTTSPIGPRQLAQNDFKASTPATNGGYSIHGRRQEGLSPATKTLFQHRQISINIHLPPPQSCKLPTTLSHRRPIQNLQHS